MPTDADPTVATATDPRDARILSLESQLAASKAELKTESDKHDFQRRRADALEKKGSVKLPAGDFVSLGGTIHPVINTVRADNTFAEVKRGHVNEGACMVVIDKQH